MQAQNQMILDHLRTGQTITPLDALKQYGCFRLGARIWDLRQAGHNIETDTVQKSGKRFASYRMAS